MHQNDDEDDVIVLAAQILTRVEVLRGREDVVWSVLTYSLPASVLSPCADNLQ